MNENLAEDFATGWEPSTIEMGLVYLAVIVLVFILYAIAKRDSRQEKERLSKRYWSEVTKAPHDTSRKHQRRN